MEDACIQVISPNRTYIPTSNQQHYNLVVKVSRNKKKQTKSDDIKCHEKRLELLLYVFPWFLMPFWLSAISGWFDFGGLSPRKGSNSNCLRIYIPIIGKLNIVDIEVFPQYYGHITSSEYSLY